MRPFFVTLAVVLVLTMSCSFTKTTPVELTVEDVIITTSELMEMGLDSAEEVKGEKPDTLAILGESYCQSCFGIKWNVGAGSLGISVMNFQNETDTKATLPKMLDDYDYLGYVHTPLTELEYVDETFSTNHLPSNATVAYLRDKELYFFVLLSQEGHNIVVTETAIYNSQGLDDYKPFIWMITELANEQWKKIEMLQN